MTNVPGLISLPSGELAVPPDPVPDSHAEPRTPGHAYLSVSDHAWRPVGSLTRALEMHPQWAARYQPTRSYTSSAEVEDPEFRDESKWFVTGICISADKKIHVALKNPAWANEKVGGTRRAALHPTKVESATMNYIAGPGRECIDGPSEVDLSVNP